MREQILALLFALAVLVLPLHAQTDLNASNSGSAPSAQDSSASSAEPQVVGEVASLSGAASSSEPAPASAAASAADSEPAGASAAPAPAAASPAQGPFGFATLAYDHGFVLSTENGLYSIRLNGLFQPRFTEFRPGSDAVALGAAPGNVNDFDVFLGRLALSGSAFAPGVNYFVQFQVSTSGNTTTTDFIDWFIAKKFSNAFTIQMGRSWTPFSYENYDNPGQYLFADFSSAEYAFALSRAIGAEVSGGAGRANYALMISNSIPALDAPGQENFNNKMAYIGHLEFNILAPYGYQESDPSPGGAAKPELTLWLSGGYNPIAADSNFSNWTIGDKTGNATATLGFRVKYFTLQSTGFYRDTYGNSAHPDFNSWGFAEQGGYYLVPGRFELVGRVDGVNWGAPDFLTVSPGDTTNTWYSGPNFPFHRVTEHSVGVNYYFHGHNVKVQADYSYLNGNTFSDAGFSGNRIRAQAQVMF